MHLSPESLIPLSSALSLTRDEVRDLHKNYGNASLAGMLKMLDFDRQFVRAQGVKLWDNEGQEYLDFLGGYGALNLGHNHPEIIAALAQVHQMPNLLQASIPTMAASLLHNLAAITPGKLKRSFLCNSGAEAVEGALKLARIATGRSTYVYCQNSFHGKSYGALSITGRDKYRKPFEPLLSDTVSVPFGDIEALRQVLKENKVAAFIVEPVQGEGGVVIPPTGYLAEALNACQQTGALFIADEIQTGFGRTGTMFSCQHENVEPDVMCLAKSLGGGIMPIGAFITTDELWQKAYGSMEKASLHTSTFGGNTWSAAAGITTIEILIRENMAQAAAEKGDYFIEGLQVLREKYQILKEVRGQGLLIGIELAASGGLASIATLGAASKLSNEYLGSMVAGELLNKHRIVTAYTLNNPNVIRLEPPLVVSKEEIDYVLNALEDVLKQHKGFFSFAAASAKTMLGGKRKK